jgi:hypothetical protein
MRRVNRSMRKAIDFSSLMDWTYRISEADAEVLRRKDQDSRNKK